jgi:hypothetical protein
MEDRKARRPLASLNSRPEILVQQSIEVRVAAQTANCTAALDDAAFRQTFSPLPAAVEPRCQ